MCCENHSGGYAPLVGGKLPEFKLKALVDNKFVDVSSADYKGKWLVLFFIRRLLLLYVPRNYRN